MAVVTIGGFEFAIEPETASWTYRMNIKPEDTYGGRVVQLLACTIDGMSVSGHICPAKWSFDPDNSRRDELNKNIQWNAMREFEYNVRQIMEYHESAKAPVEFDFPEAGWEGMVYVTGYSKVQYEPDIPSVQYTLSMDIDSGFNDIAEAAGDYGLAAIPDGVGWVRSVYNTPGTTDFDKVKKAMEKFVDDAGTFDASKPADFFDYLMNADDTEGDLVVTVKDALDAVAKVTTVAYTAANVLSGLGLVSNWAAKNGG